MQEQGHKLQPHVKARVDQRIAFVKEATTTVPGLVSQTHIMTMLTEPEPGASTRAKKIWDQSCDGCGKHTPSQLVMGQVEETWGSAVIIIVFGLCPDCAVEPD